MSLKYILGVDVGGSGIKGAIVNVQSGTLLSERLRLETPQPATPEAVSNTFASLVQQLKWNGPVGVGFPAIVKQGVAYSAANIDKEWIGTNVAQQFSEASGCEVFVLNDADAAGLAEIQFGWGRERSGLIIMITIGTGLGSAVFVNGQLVPNTEFGHVYLPGHKEDAETYTSNAARKRGGLSWAEWGSRFNEYLQYLQDLFSPDCFILGGGASKKFGEYSDQLDLGGPVLPAKLLNNAGLIGGAGYAAEHVRKLEQAK